MLLLDQGHTLVAAIVGAAVAILLARLRREAHRDTVLRWNQGIWTLGVEPGFAATGLGAGSGGAIQSSRKPIEPLASSVLLPNLIYFCFRELPLGKRQGMWLFADSASAEQLRQLRVRLVLDGCID